jgi:hypothetical protein
MMEKNRGRCPDCAGWLGLSRIEEIVFLYCRVCGYFELDRGDDSFSGSADTLRMRRLRLLLAAEIPNQSQLPAA